MTTERYRKDIDGLRAVAVLLVVAYHAMPKIVRGGFVGVDVFFVISGFLISGIIFRNLEAGQFSFVEFYSRRIRRIFPALIIVLIACLTIGLFLLMSSDYAFLGKHVSAASVFISNFVLESEAGYFDKAAQAKPLLHLWSLGVEEQFYIFWPFLLFVAWKKRISPFYVILVIGGLSFGLNIHRIYRHPYEVFFLPHTRIWELLVGSSLAYFAERKISLGKLYFSENGRAFSGLVLITVGAIFLSHESVFPGFAALLPVIGTLLLISAGEGAWLNRIFLGNKFIVGVGLISYPLYLWHWPLFSFLRMTGFDNNVTILGVVGVSFLLSFATYIFLKNQSGTQKWHFLCCVPYCLSE